MGDGKRPFDGGSAGDDCADELADVEASGTSSMLATVGDRSLSSRSELCLLITGVSALSPSPTALALLVMRLLLTCSNPAADRR